MLVAGCGSDGGGGRAIPPLGSTDDQVDATTDTTPRTVDESSTEPFTATRTYEWEVTSTNGEEASVTVELGDLVHADSDSVPPDLAGYLSICEVDAQRDAAIPLRLSATNTTDGFDTELEVGLQLRNAGNSYDLQFATATTFSDGDSCRDHEDAKEVAGVDFGNLAAGDSGSHSWLLLVKGYYSPAEPDGNETVLGEWAAGIKVDSLATADDVVPNVTCFSGPAGKFLRGSILPLGLGIYGGFPVADADVDDLGFTKRDPSDDDPPSC